MGLGASAPPSFRAALLLLSLAGVACTTPPAPDRTGGEPVAGPTGSPTAGAPSVLRLSILEPDSLDPIDLDAPHELLLADQVFDGLVEWDPLTAQALPALARDWTVEDGGATIEFRLRKGLRYHDGTPVRAADFVTAWSRLADPLVAAPYGFLLEPVAGYGAFQRRPVDRLEGVEALDDRTLVVRLRDPWPDFVTLTGHPALAPVPPSVDRGTFGTQPVGTGPYRLLTPATPGAPVVLERFSRFYGERPVTDELHFEVVSEADQAWPDFLAGELDVATVPTSAVVDAETQYGSAGIVPLARLLYCGFNQQDPRFADPDLRVATSLALDRGAIFGEVYAGAGTPATGIVPPTLPGALTDACGDLCRTDPDRARRLASRIPRPDRAFALDYVASPLGDALARAIAEQLRAVGLQVTPRAHGQEEYLQLLLEERQQFFCLVWTADYPRQQAILEPLLLPGSPDNHAAVDDPALTEILERARAERSGGKRQELYAEAELRALSRMHIVPVMWFSSRFAAQPYVEGLTVDPLGLFDAAALRVEP